jgi:hypothetical protein
MSAAHSTSLSSVLEPPAKLWQYARKEIVQAGPGCERRRDRRYSLITSVRCVPVDGRHQPIGESFVALSSGMSVSGIRLIHTEPAPSKFLRLEFEGQPAQFVLSVVRTRPIGDCYEIAGRLRTLRRPEQLEAVATVAPTLNELEVERDVASRSAGVCDEILHWAGVSAAAQALVADRKTSR